MAENINIGGRLHSTATGNVVAGANEILDDTKGKKQSVVNQETDAALADRYTKEETYSKQELNGMVSPQHDYVVVETYADLADITDHSNGCVYRVSNYDGTNSQVDATMYSEYAWDGTQYVHLATKSQIGEVFDVSEYNATGGTLATYASLDALLSDANLGTIIPVGVRKGGMSIKFVQSSDNKYVQYRLMSDTFNTTPANWQGVDDEPTDGSDNLVKSGGVQKACEELRNLKVSISCGKNLFDKTNCIIGYYINSSGKILELSGAGITPLIEISPNTEYTYSFGASSNAFHDKYGIFYDENLNVVSIQEPARTFITPQNAKYLIATFGVSHINEIQLEVGNTRTAYEEFNPIAGYVSPIVAQVVAQVEANTQNIAANTQNIAANTADIGRVSFTLEQGSLNPNTGTKIDSDTKRVRTSLIKSTLNITTNSGYYITRVIEYNKDNDSFIQTLVNTTGQTSYIYNGSEAIRIVFRKEPASSTITPSDNVIDSAVIEGSLMQRVDSLQNEFVPKDSYATFNLTNSQVQGFIDSADYDDNDYSYTNVTDITGRVALKRDTPNPVRLTWIPTSDTLRTFVTLIQNGAGTRLSDHAQTFEIPYGNNYLEIYNLIPGKTYLYGIYIDTPSGTKTLMESSFVTTGQVRMIKVNRVPNVRDIGGWAAENNKKIKYGLIYRGSEFNPIEDGSTSLLSQASVEMMRNNLGIKGEIDLRGAYSHLYNTRTGESVVSSLLGSDIVYSRFSYTAYVGAITSGTTIDSIINTLVSNLQDNKPTYIHCAGGCDRTGTVIALIMGACGVSESDIAKEYELTSFSGMTRTRNSTVYDYSGMITAIKSYNGSTFQEKVTSFLTTDGNVPISDIETLKSLLLI